MDMCRTRRRELITVEDFMMLSAEISYQFSAKELNKKAMLSLITGYDTFTNEDLAQEAIECLLLGYDKRNRKLGPLAILHPLRTTALLYRSIPEPSLLHLLGSLFHDKREDLTPNEIGEERWVRFEESFNHIEEKIDLNHRWYLGERLNLLHLKPSGTYSAYLNDILHAARDSGMPDLLHVKLADRLDNTLDTHVLRPGVTRYNFFRTFFDILFVPGYHGVQINEYHFLPEEHETLLLLSQLYKNAIFLSMIRKHSMDRLDSITIRLFDGLAVASIREAQWIALELLATYITDTQRQRELLLETMRYSVEGGITTIRNGGNGISLDGLFLDRFAPPDKQFRTDKLSELFHDKEALVTVVIAFIATFSAFLNNPDYYIEGVERVGHVAMGS